MQTFGSDAPWEIASVQTRSMTLAPIYYFKFTHTPDSDSGFEFRNVNMCLSGYVTVPLPFTSYFFLDFFNSVE